MVKEQNEKQKERTDEMETIKKTPAKEIPTTPSAENADQNSQESEEQETQENHVDINELTAEIDRLKDQMLRAMAETENTRRRLSKEIEDTRKYAISNFAKEMLIVADNFRRALDAIPKDVGDNEVLKQLIAGVEATERHLLSAFEKFGIKKINPLGQQFDPHYHQVMMEIDDPNHPAGTVVQVIQEGYMIYDRLLRAAVVAVSKGSPTVAKVDTSA